MVHIGQELSDSGPYEAIGSDGCGVETYKVAQSLNEALGSESVHIEILDNSLAQNFHSKACNVLSAPPQSVQPTPIPAPALEIDPHL